MDHDLTLLDYLVNPLTELVAHPQFSRDAHLRALDLAQLSSNEIVDIHKKYFGGND